MIMYISLSYGLYFLSSIKSGDYGKRNCGGPSNWFIHRYKNPTFIRLLSQDQCELTKPTITIKYNNEYYLYVFDFYNHNSKFKETVLYLKMMEFKNMASVEPIIVTETFYIFLADTMLDNYDHDEEALLTNDKTMYDPDKCGGCIYFSEL